MEIHKYDVAVIGGGLGGLTLAIQQADAGRSVLLLEKRKYPFHKVCGEYISLESKGFLERLGLDLDSMDLPLIKRLNVSSPKGDLLSHELDLGGFGISRFLLDSKLAELAKAKGVELIDDCTVNNVSFSKELFTIETNDKIYNSEICVGSWGKKSNLDVKLKRDFTIDKQTHNYVGIKYHVYLDFPADLIELHNFAKGYCGISRIESNRYCLCYLTDSENLKKFNGDIRMMEKGILMKNPYLKKYLSTAEYLFQEPLAISQIKIGYKSAVEKRILMVGDAAGNIAPLSGNGMSMAMRSSFELNKLLSAYFKKQLTREQLENEYIKTWRKLFKTRVDLSALLQRLLKNTLLTGFAIKALRLLPWLREKVVRSTHGKPF
jgi:flavin-dependent dehydrogenase